MKEVLQDLIRYTESAEKVVVEAAHIYADKEPGVEQQASTLVAFEVLSILHKPSHRILLIDDIHVSNFTLDLEAYQKWLTEQGFSVDETVLESTLIPEAHQLLCKIKDILTPRKLKSAKNNGWSSSTNQSLCLWTEAGRVPLLTSAGQPTCDLLDATLYIKKAQVAETCVTILPSSYRQQQLETLFLLKRVRPDIAIVNIFFNPMNVLDDLIVTSNMRKKQ